MKITPSCKPAVGPSGGFCHHHPSHGKGTREFYSRFFFLEKRSWLSASTSGGSNLTFQILIFIITDTCCKCTSLVVAAPSSLTNTSALPAGQTGALLVPATSLRPMTPLYLHSILCSSCPCAACQGSGFPREETVRSIPRRKNSWNTCERESVRMVVQGIAWEWAKKQHKDLP